MSKFRFTSTQIPGVILVEPQVHHDNRGHFFEAWSSESFSAVGIECAFVQVNQSLSKRGVLRGLHFQRPPFEQDKLVRVVRGRVFDVAVDMRRDSIAFGRWVGAMLSDQNKRQLYIPKGCAHGFLTMSDEAELLYHVSEPYNAAAEAGIRFDDPELAIRWPERPAMLSDKDLFLPNFKVAVEEDAYEGQLIFT